MGGTTLGALCALDQTAAAPEGAAFSVNLMTGALIRILPGNPDIAGPDRD